MPPLTENWDMHTDSRDVGGIRRGVRASASTRPLGQGQRLGVEHLLYLGQYRKFLESLPVDDSSFDLFYRGFGEFYEKDFDQASRDFDRAYELDPTLYAGIGKALSDSIHQRKAEGLDLLRRLESKIRERGVVTQKPHTRSRKHMQCWETKSPLCACYA